jgi:hypothetical protein
MECEEKSLPMISLFLLRAGATLNLVALHHAANLYGEEPVKELSVANGCYEMVNVTHQEVC